MHNEPVRDMVSELRLVEWLKVNKVFLGFIGAL